jgi:hypothetical protein
MPRPPPHESWLPYIDVALWNGSDPDPTTTRAVNTWILSRVAVYQREEADNYDHSLFYTV